MRQEFQEVVDELNIEYDVDIRGVDESGNVPELVLVVDDVKFNVKYESGAGMYHITSMDIFNSDALDMHESSSNLNGVVSTIELGVSKSE